MIRDDLNRGVLLDEVGHQRDGGIGAEVVEADQARRGHAAGVFIADEINVVFFAKGEAGVLEQQVERLVERQAVGFGGDAFFGGIVDDKIDLHLRAHLT